MFVLDCYLDRIEVEYFSWLSYTPGGSGFCRRGVQCTQRLSPSLFMIDIMDLGPFLYNGGVVHKDSQISDAEL